MLKIINWPCARAERYHRYLPDGIRQYLKGRGIPATYIERHRLGWDGSRITIPILGQNRDEVLGFRYANPPVDLIGEPEIVSEESTKPELYGWETLVRTPHRIVVTDNEFDRLVLEANGFPAVTPIPDAGSFEEWVKYFDGIDHVYVLFRGDGSGAARAAKLQELLPAARIVKFPSGVPTVTDFFVTLGRTKVDFEVLLAAAAAENGTPKDLPPAIREFRPYQKALQKRADRVKRAVPLHRIAEQYVTLQASGAHLVGHCPFHDEQSPSFAVYPESNTYYCFGCGAHGDAIRFLMDKESMTYGQALEALERFEFTNELYSAAS